MFAFLSEALLIEIQEEIHHLAGWEGGGSGHKNCEQNFCEQTGVSNHVLCFPWLSIQVQDCSWGEFWEEAGLVVQSLWKRHVLSSTGGSSMDLLLNVWLPCYLGARLRCRRRPHASKERSEKVLGRVPGKGFQKGS